MPDLHDVIKNLLAMLDATEACHGCVGMSRNWLAYKEQLDVAADLVDIPLSERWWEV